VPAPARRHSGGENEGGATGRATSAPQSFEARGSFLGAEAAGAVDRQCPGKPSRPERPPANPGSQTGASSDPARPEPFVARPLRLEGADAPGIA